MTTKEIAEQYALGNHETVRKEIKKGTTRDSLRSAKRVLDVHECLRNNYGSCEALSFSCWIRLYERNR